MELTETQQYIFDFMHQVHKSEGRMPTQREMAEVLNLSKSRVKVALRTLERKGYLIRSSFGEGRYNFRR